MHSRSEEALPDLPRLLLVLCCAWRYAGVRSVYTCRYVLNNSTSNFLRMSGASMASDLELTAYGMRPDTAR